jgi:hypothetical protein
MAVALLARPSNNHPNSCSTAWRLLITESGSSRLHPNPIICRHFRQSLKSISGVVGLVKLVTDDHHVTPSSAGTSHMAAPDTRRHQLPKAVRFLRENKSFNVVLTESLAHVIQRFRNSRKTNDAHPRREIAPGELRAKAAPHRPRQHMLRGNPMSSESCRRRLCSCGDPDRPSCK